MNFRKLIFVFIAFSIASVSKADGWKTVSDVGIVGLIGFALATPAYKDDWQGVEQAGYSLVGASAVSLVGKAFIDEQRPDKSGYDSFPSGHAANAFAAATTLNIRYGWKMGLPAYGLATLVSVGRVEADKHYWKDVLAGAAIGSLSGWIFTSRLNDNVRLMPLLSRKQGVLMASVNF